MKKKIIIGLIIIAAIIAIALAFGNNGSNGVDSSKINIDNFNKINMGAKYSDIVELIGEGTEEMSSDINGVESVGYSWNVEGLGYIKVIVDDGIVTTKSQTGLKSTCDDKVTLEKYNQLQEGMTYSQVKAILGEGQIKFQNKYGNFETIMCKWINKDASNIDITFSDDKLSQKSQLNLK